MSAARTIKRMTNTAHENEILNAVYLKFSAMYGVNERKNVMISFD